MKSIRILTRLLSLINALRGELVSLMIMKLCRQEKSPQHNKESHDEMSPNKTPNSPSEKQPMVSFAEGPLSSPRNLPNPHPPQTKTSDASEGSSSVSLEERHRVPKRKKTRASPQFPPIGHITASGYFEIRNAGS